MFLGQTDPSIKTFWGTKENILPNWFRFFYFIPVFSRQTFLAWLIHQEFCPDSVWCTDVYVIDLCRWVKSPSDLFRLCRVSKLGCIIWAGFLFGLLPLHPHSLFLFLFIHRLQQFGQVTIHINCRIRKWTSAKKADIQTHFALCDTSRTVGKRRVRVELWLKFAKLASTENRVGLKEKRPGGNL